MSSESPSQVSQPLVALDLLALRHFIVETTLLYLFLGIYGTFSVTAVVMILSNNLLMTEYTLLQISGSGFNPDFDYIDLVSNRLLMAITTLVKIPFLISDSIVVWRAWILINNQSTVKTILAFCLILSFVGSAVDIGRAIVRLMDIPYSIGGKADSLVLILPLLFTNLVSTSVIGYKTW
ncbi:hypothetical protein K435DRAFT_811255 [Dendrothele bispora CBS 962.96]|uniref:Uncharacterized protein n=1 Tax=Dendrothele bispora (strain CBS 962.96) TaxID=1314807 RepID=A0A4S8KSK8_DENBC|nr:hypothetical protein K435DRAFT_811255 [Dendrothele bispora CBS 962.96]